ncbi:hypothetical protein HQ393_13560 [Chitinibacter bivalviorum]|uniref:Uncharacterized protein n=1 Tax=Chitinibacter bivalviorum TaxID=2739434 RepID=A0A7H9BLF1_9NEIS|nr:hypothetical protein [Chitinibacter bivalviorum]QLG89186.1 hypothetical protein HQ393_13560 [Chitinibacter bivalviorum]
MVYAIHPVWGTTQRPESLRYGLYQVSSQGEVEIARALRLESVETLRQHLLNHSNTK